MKKIGPGVLENSEIYFSSVSPKAQKLFYNVLCAGHFYCDSNYHLVRENYGSILILCVVRGTFTFKNRQGEYLTASENETVVLDCFEPHEYFTNDSLESVWIHVSGVNCRDILTEITENKGNIIIRENFGYISSKLFKISEEIKRSRGFSEENMSAEVYTLLLKILNSATFKQKSDGLHDDIIKSVKEYISGHIAEKITVATLADSVHMSPTHFSRIFKQYTGFSPYDYVLVMRLNKAKELLLKTDMSVAQIAYDTGFNSQANFVYCFTGSEGVSPGRFRKIGF